jgi:uncharacterized protein
LGLVDRLRGFALLGVVVVNAPLLLTSSAGTDPREVTTALDRAAALITWIVFQGKAYLVFAFLFGYSLTIFLDSVTAKGLSPTRLYVQRLAALGVLGCVHAIVLFPGDILVVYAVLGLMLIPLRRRGDRTLKRIAMAFYALQAICLVGLALLPTGSDGAGPSLSDIDAQLATGGLAATSAAHLTLWPGYLVFMLLVQGALVGGMFCLGLLAGRHGLLREVDPHRSAWLRARRWGLGVGLPVQTLSGWLALRPRTGELGEYLGLVLQYLTAPVLSAGIVATIVLLPRRGLTRLVEADGRMSLTIYLAESLLLTVLAVGWGFGLMGLQPAATLGAALCVWVVLLGFAHLWHSRGLGNGPAERVLRRLTYAGARRRSPKPAQPSLL